MTYDPRKTLYADPIKRRWVQCTGIAAVLVTLISFAVAIWAWSQRKQEPVLIIAALWAVVPPSWFWIEYFWVYRPHAEEGSFEYFRHGQQISAAIWAGLALTFGALATSDHFKDKDAEPKVDVAARLCCDDGLVACQPALERRADGL